MTPIDQLFAVVDAFREARGISDATVSTQVFNDGGRITQLRSGTDIGTRRLARAMAWFSDNWPDGASWPVLVARPDRTIKEMEEA